jgi:hypothetical protein
MREEGLCPRRVDAPTKTYIQHFTAITFYCCRKRCCDFNAMGEVNGWTAVMMTTDTIETWAHSSGPGYRKGCVEQGHKLRHIKCETTDIA